ncbi:hypothetical protein NKH77_16720 [Streptomyces sp. M19]
MRSARAAPGGPAAADRPGRGLPGRAAAPQRPVGVHRLPGAGGPAGRDVRPRAADAAIADGHRAVAAGDRAALGAVNQRLRRLLPPQIAWQIDNEGGLR